MPNRRDIFGVSLFAAALNIGCASTPRPAATPASTDIAIPAPRETPAMRERLEVYDARTLRGFTVRINRQFITEDPTLLSRVLLALEFDLDLIEGFLPPAAFARLLRVPIWIELQGATIPGGMSGRGMCFHPSPDWLGQHGLLREKAGGIEIVNPQDFLDWRRNQPFMTFHELAHAYHFGLSYDNPDILAVYRTAMDQGLYDAVAYNLDPAGGPRRAYAAANQMEYFAELSEAYFALNDYFPFTRPQLEAHDPRGFKLMEQLWNPPEPGP